MEGDDDTITKASVHLENFVEEMNCRTTGEKASIFPGKSAADIWSAVKGRIGIHSSISKICKEFVEFKKTLTRLHSCAKSNDVEMAIELVLNDGIDVNVARLRDITPLVWASPAASSLSIKTLIDLGADVNAEIDQDKLSFFCDGPHSMLQSLATMQLSLKCYLRTWRMQILVTNTEIQLYIHPLPNDFSAFHSCL